MSVEEQGVAGVGCEELSGSKFFKVRDKSGQHIIMRSADLHSEWRKNIACAKLGNGFPSGTAALKSSLDSLTAALLLFQCWR